MAVPRLSVGIPVRDGMSHLEQVLAACLDDDVDGLEVVVCDNGSTDGTEVFVQDLAASDPRVRYLPADHPLPVLENFRRCVALSSGTYFRWNGHDDWPSPGLQRRLLDELEARPDAAGTVTDVQFVDEQGTEGLYHREHLPGADHHDPLRRLHAVVWHLRSSSTPAFTLMRRTALDRTGLLRDIPEASKVLAAELAATGPLLSVDGPVLYRTFADVHRLRDHWVWLDPARNAGRRPLSTPRQVRWHLQAVADAPMSLPRRVASAVDVFAGLVVRRTAGKAASIRRRVSGQEWVAPV